MLFEKKHMKLLTHLPKEKLVREGWTEYSKDGWFLYFWKEARQQAGIESRTAEVLPFFNEMYEVPADWDPQNLGPDLELAGQFIFFKAGMSEAEVDEKLAPIKLKYKSSWDGVSDANLLKCLKACLAAGFERIRADTSVNPLGNVSDTNSSLVFARHSLILDNDHSYSVGWRGDSRTMTELRDAGGFLSKADSDKKDPHTQLSYADKINLRAPWNPFSDPKVRCDYYYRKMQQDNCLHTVVSVTMDFVTAASFPKLEDLIGGLLGGRKLKASETVESPPAELKSKMCNVRVRGKDIVRFADSQQLYLVVLFGGFFDTQARQRGKNTGDNDKSFPEVAVKQIPVNGILGSVTFVRVFHGLTENEGFTALWNIGASKRPERDACIAFAGEENIGLSLWNELRKQYRATTNSMPLRARWTGSGGKKMADPLDVMSVKTPDGKKLY